MLVDLVRDRAPQGAQPKLHRGNIVLDPPEEILAKKLCALLSRAEMRDVVDVILLERAGYSVEQAMSLAAQKDAGMTPAQLAWVLSQIGVSEATTIPGDLSASEVRDFLAKLTERLLRWAYPPLP